MENKIHVTFLRHARSRADDENVHEGRYDSPLTDVGRAQVQARAQDFLERKFQFDRIVASTLQRAHETAKIIGQALNTPVETDPDWMELDNGPLAGMSVRRRWSNIPCRVSAIPTNRFVELVRVIGKFTVAARDLLKKSFGAARAVIWSLRMVASSTAHCEPSSERSHS
jgi:broad specificity phosphatase PhoE